MRRILPFVIAGLVAACPAARPPISTPAPREAVRVEARPKSAIGFRLSNAEDVDEGKTIAIAPGVTIAEGEAKALTARFGPLPASPPSKDPPVRSMPPPSPGKVVEQTFPPPPAPRPSAA